MERGLFLFTFGRGRASYTQYVSGENCAQAFRRTYDVMATDSEDIASGKGTVQQLRTRFRGSCLKCLLNNFKYVHGSIKPPIWSPASWPNTFLNPVWLDGSDLTSQALTPDRLGSLRSFPQPPNQTEFKQVCTV